MTQNIPKRSFLVHSTFRWTCGRSVIYDLFAHGAHESEAEKNNNNKKNKKTTKNKTKRFFINFDGSVGKPETRLFIFRPNGGA